MKKFLFALLGILMLSAFTLGASKDAVRKAIAKSLYGNIYLECSSNRADFTVCLVSEGHADLKVWRAESERLADAPGRWHFVSSRNRADYSVYITESSGFADIWICYVDSRSHAGL